MAGGNGRGDVPVAQVTDAADPRLDLYRRMADPGPRRRIEAESGTFVAEGRVAVGQLVRSGLPIRSLLVDTRQAVHAVDLVEAVRERGAPVYVAPPEVLASTVGFSLHRGVVAVADRPTEPSASSVLAAAVSARPGAVPAVAILEAVNDHENIGALFRNAAAFGVGGVLLDPRCADPWYRRSVRVSVGQVMHVPFARLAPWPDALAEVRTAGFVIVALVPRPVVGGRVPVPVPVQQLRSVADGGSGRKPRPVALLLGAEGPGLSPPALARADTVVTIPMAEGVDSLNVATAAAIAFHRLAAP